MVSYGLSTSFRCASPTHLIVIPSSCSMKLIHHLAQYSSCSELYRDLNHTGGTKKKEDKKIIISLQTRHQCSIWSLDALIPIKPSNPCQQGTWKLNDDDMHEMPIIRSPSVYPFLRQSVCSPKQVHHFCRQHRYSSKWDTFMHICMCAAS